MNIDGNWIAAASSLVTVGTVIFTGIFGAGRRNADILTRREHESICERREAETREALDRIEGKIDANEQHARRTREELRDALHAVKLDVAVLKDRSP